MNIGVYVDAHPAIAEQARMIEAAGFSHLWVYDSPLVFGEPYMAMLDAARATSRITIGPGVTHPLGRPPFATAQALATLASVAPGRVVMGIGIGNSARRSLGMRPATLDQLHEHVRVVRELLAGRTVDYREGERSHPIRFLHPDGRWLDLSRQIEVWVSAFGPKGQARAGADADAIFVRWEGEEALTAARERFTGAALAAGRNPATLKMAVVFAVYPIEDEAELETPEARAALGPLVVSRLRYLTANHRHSSEVAPAFRPGFDAYLEYRESLDPETRHVENYEGYLVFTPEHLERFVTPESIRTVALVGDVDEVAAELRRMADAGVDHVSLQMAGPPALWCARMREVMANVPAVLA